MVTSAHVDAMESAVRAAGSIRPIDGGGGGGGLPTSGGTMTGDIDMGGFSVVNATLDTATTAISTTTAALGLAHVYEATAAPITITVSTAYFVEGRAFSFIVRTASATVGTPVTIATEGAQTIDGDSSVDMIFDHDNRAFIVQAGNLVSIPS